MSHEVVDIRSLLRWDDPEVLRITEQVFEKCILGKVFPPEVPLAHPWISPGGCYRGQWIWDTMFVVDLLSLLPGTESVIRDVFQNYWDFQARWNALMPDHAHDMIACMIEPGKREEEWLKYPAYSQIPILAWGLERVYRRNGDRDLVSRSLSPLERFHDWYWRERDVSGTGLLSVGAYTDAPVGIYDAVQQARFETFDFECNLDGLKLTRHPVRTGAGEGKWYGDICLPGITAYLVLAEQCLARLAEIMGDGGMAARRRVRAAQGAEAMRKHMWDQGSGVFFAVKRDTLEKIPVATIGSWIPLHAGIPTPNQAARMAEAFRTEGWQTPLPVPTVDRRDMRYASAGMWRGDVWPATNYQVADGFAAYGFRDLAAEIADKTIANAIRNGISEHYDSVSGKAIGVEFLGMTCTIVTMMLDQLSRRFRLQVLDS
ncbi:MAG: trehalase family glycosidase [bacterium]